MELFEQHMRDTVSYEKFVDIDRANQRMFETKVDIPCRVVNKYSIVKLRNEEEVVSKKTIYTRNLVGEMDRVDGMDVLYIREYKSLLDNEVWGYEVKI